MAIQALINCFVCDLYSEVLSLPVAVTFAFCKEVGRQCFYYNNGTTWTRIAGKFTSLDVTAPLNMTSGVLGFDSSVFATAVQGAKADTALQSEQFSVPYLPGSTTFTKMPSADAELPDINSRQLLDLTRFNSFRVTGRVSAIGFPGSSLRFQYATTDSGPYADLYSLGSISLTLGEQDTSWCPLPMLAKVGSVYLRLTGKGGDSHVNPQISQLTLSFKS
jgi:hypothetical protein